MDELARRRRAIPEDCVFPDDQGGFSWRVLGPSGEVIAQSQRSFTRRRDAVRAFRTAQRSFAVRPDEDPPRAA